MFAPHHGKNTELREVRLAPEDFLDPLEFFRRKAVLFDQFECNNWIGVRSFARHWRSMLLNSRRPLKSPKFRNPSNYVIPTGEEIKRTRSVRLSLEPRTVKVNLIKKEA